MGTDGTAVQCIKVFHGGLALIDLWTQLENWFIKILKNYIKLFEHEGELSTWMIWEFEQCNVMELIRDSIYAVYHRLVHQYTL